MATVQNSISFLELAQQVLAKEQKPLTIDEIWDVAEKAGLVAQLDSTGKTPKRTLGARLYTDAKDSSGMFQKVGAGPARFTLRTLAAGLSKEQLEQQVPEIAPTMAKSVPYSERDLHPLMVWFAKTEFEADCKTIYHEKGLKRGPKHNQWLYPDVAGFALSSKNWNQEVVNLAQQSGYRSARLFSFELKIFLSDFYTLREYFFQAVSNSSWANEGYLAAAEIGEAPDFLKELTRLSQSFGIGVIHLDTAEPLNSEVILPARGKSVIDWETVSRISEDNEDFRGFVASVANSIKVNQIVTSNFDAKKDDKQITEYVKEKLAAQPAMPPA
jgi:hypothetical protein